MRRANYAAVSFPEAIDDIQVWYTMTDDGVGAVQTSFSSEVEIGNQESFECYSALLKIIEPPSRERPDAFDDQNT